MHIRLSCQQQRLNHQPAHNGYTKTPPHPSILSVMMRDDATAETSDSKRRLEEAYRSERPKFLARTRAAGRSLEEAEDLVHDVYAEMSERLHLVSQIQNLPAWINSMFQRRMIDLWRHEKARKASGEVQVAEETLREIISEVGLDPLDRYVRQSLTEALNDAIRALPKEQRAVVEAQVFGGQTFRQIAEATGESIDALTARKRYAVAKLSRALRHWIEE